MSAFKVHVLPGVAAAGLVFAATFFLRHGPHHEAGTRAAPSPAPAPAPARPPGLVAGRTTIPLAQIAGVRDRIRLASKEVPGQLVRTLEGLTREELSALLLSNEPLWEGEEIYPWKLRLFARLAELDLPAALGLAGEIFPEPSMFCAAVRPCLLQWAARDPGAAAAWWRAQPVAVSKISGEDWEKIDAVMAQLVPDNALLARIDAAVAALPAEMPSKLKEKKAWEDRQSARQRVEEVHQLKCVTSATRQRLLEGLLARGPVACELADAASVAAYWADSQPADAHAWLDKAVTKWPAAAELAPAMALQEIRNYFPGTPRDAAALALWAQRLNPVGCTQEWWTGLVTTTAQGSRPAHALRLLESMPAGVDRAPAVEAWLKHSESMDEPAARRIIATLPDPARQAAALSLLEDKLRNSK